MSRSTLLRHLHCRSQAVQVETPRVLGIDDWAWRKGHRYGTILCDLEKRRVIDLLPDREADTVAAWLRQHPGIQVVSRDRGGIYAEAARRAARSATQVADRWHVLHNLTEALKRALNPHHPLLTQAARASRADEVPLATLPQAPWNACELVVQQQNRQRRLDRYQQVRSLIKTGASMAAIAEQIGIDHRTVRKFIRADVFPEAGPRIHRCIVDPYAEYLDKRLRDGCRSPTRLWRELCSQGFRGKENIVRYWLLRRRGHQQQKQTAPRRPVVRVSSRQAVWSIFKSTSGLSQRAVSNST